MLSKTNTLRLQAAAGTHPGRVHKVNQDNALAVVGPKKGNRTSGLFVVADGMGGHQAGEIASRLAVETLQEELAWLLERDDVEDTQPTLPNSLATTQVDTPNQQLQMRLELAISRANQVIASYAQDNPQQAGNLGTTITCALVEGNQAAIANVGDSRTYLLRGGRLYQVTEDHSYVARLVREGHIEPEEIFDHPRRNVITRSLGNRLDVEIDSWSQDLQPGDRLLLCSDGLWEMVQDSSYIEAQLRDSARPEETVQQLIAAANHYGGVDNIGVVVVHVEAG